MKTEKIKSKLNKKSFDVIFLEERIKVLVKWEEYERAAVVKRWINELSEKQR